MIKHKYNKYKHKYLNLKKIKYGKGDKDDNNEIKEDFLKILLKFITNEHSKILYNRDYFAGFTDYGNVKLNYILINKFNNYKESIKIFNNYIKSGDDINILLKNRIKTKEDFLLKNQFINICYYYELFIDKIEEFNNLNKNDNNNQEGGGGILNDLKFYLNNLFNIKDSTIKEKGNDNNKKNDNNKNNKKKIFDKENIEQLNGNKDNIIDNNNIEQLNKDIENKNKQLNELNEDINKKMDELKELDEKMGKLMEINKEMENLNTEIDGKIKELIKEKYIKKFEKIYLKGEMVKLNEEIKELNIKMVKLNEEMDELNKKIDELNQKKSNLKKEMKNLEENMENKNNYIINLNEEKIKKDNDIENLNKVIDFILIFLNKNAVNMIQYHICNLSKIVYLYYFKFKNSDLLKETENILVKPFYNYNEIFYNNNLKNYFDNVQNIMINYIMTTKKEYEINMKDINIINHFDLLLQYNPTFINILFLYQNFLIYKIEIDIIDIDTKTYIETIFEINKNLF